MIAATARRQFKCQCGVRNCHSIIYREGESITINLKGKVWKKPSARRKNLKLSITKKEPVNVSNQKSEGSLSEEKKATMRVVVWLPG